MDAIVLTTSQSYIDRKKGKILSWTIRSLCDPSRNVSMTAIDNVMNIRMVFCRVCCRNISNLRRGAKQDLGKNWTTGRITISSRAKFSFSLSLSLSTETKDGYRCCRCCKVSLFLPSHPLTSFIPEQKSLVGYDMIRCSSCLVFHFLSFPDLRGSCICT